MVSVVGQLDKPYAEETLAVEPDCGCWEVSVHVAHAVAGLVDEGLHGCHICRSRDCSHVKQ